MSPQQPQPKPGPNRTPPQPKPGPEPKTETKPLAPHEVAAELNRVDDDEEPVGLDQPRASEGIFTLPAGCIDEDGNLHREIHLREMTGEEEDLLGSRQGDVVARLNQVMANCVLRFGTVEERPRILSMVRGLPIGDRNFLFVALRRVSLGDEYTMEAKCPDCEKSNTYTMDLGSLMVTPMPDPMKRMHEVELPSGRKITWEVMTGQEEEKLGELREAASGRDVLTYAIMLRVREIDGEKVSLGSRLTDARGKVSLDKEGRTLLKAIKKLTLKDRNFLREEFGEKEGGLDSDIELECPHCGISFKGSFDPGQVGFFFPSGI